MNTIAETPSAVSSLLFDTFDLGILIEDSNRTILFANKKFKQIFGLPDEMDITGTSCLDAARLSKSFFKDSDKFEQDIYSIPLADMSVEEIVEANDGRFFKRKFASVVSKEKIKSLIWSYEDVTALINNGIELEKQKTFYHTVLNEIPADIAIFSPEHKYIYLNKTAIKNDVLREWMIGKDDYEYCAYRGLDKALADTRRAHFNKTTTTGESDTWVDMRVDKEGREDYVLRIFYPYINHLNKLEFVIGYGVNINHQKKQELAIKQQRERFRTLIDTLKEGVFQISFEGEIMFYNQAFLNVMNITDDVIGTHYANSIMQYVDEDDKKQLYLSFDKLKQTKELQKGIFRVHQHDDENVLFVDYVIWHMYDAEKGDIVIGRLSDITEMVVNEQHMLKLIEKEKELNTQQSNFIHITSHELRTPLSIIMSSAEILELHEEMEAGDEEKKLIVADRKKYTTGIVKEVTKITDILNELLVVGKIENNKVNFSPALIDVEEYFNAIARELYMPYSDGRNLNLKIDHTLTQVYLDAGLMRHAIINLINNAFKYSSGKTAPELYVYGNHAMLNISVKDYGIGIPNFDTKKIFNSFYRASNVGNITGTGIGLMLVDYAVKAHKGSISVKSNLNIGSEFIIQIPL